MKVPIMKKSTILFIAIVLSVFQQCLPMEPDESYTNQNQQALNSSDEILSFAKPKYILTPPQFNLGWYQDIAALQQDNHGLHQKITALDQAIAALDQRKNN